MNSFLWYAISAVVLANGFWSTEGLGNFTVTTLSGKVEGFLGTTCRGSTSFVGFRGIPYAEPPIGQLRFKDPIPKRNWEIVWDATFERSACLQGAIDESGAPFPGDSSFSEDCLYLNVYSPNLEYFSNDQAPLKAVMVFIHMGAFIMGSSNECVTSPDFLLDRDVIVVTFNYRLGALGFLSFQNSVVPGNAGLKDQNLALKWVKNNIRFFGGDPNKITIFGESAGSASVNYHLLSELSAGLFNGAIMQSGSSLAPWAFTPSNLALKKSIKLGKKVGCNSNDVNKILECMQKIPADLVCEKQQKALTLEELFSLRVIAFQPTVEPEVPGAFLTTPPFDLMYFGNFTKVPTIIGSVADEGLLLYPAFTKHDPQGILLGLLGMDLSRFAPYDFQLRPFTKLAFETHQEISKFYFNSRMLSKALLNQVLKLLTDTMFVLPIQLTASLIANTETPVYNYLFSYDGTYSLGKASSDITEVPGVCHGDDLGYIFFTPKLHKSCGKNVSEAFVTDELMINRMTKLWANFAKTGNPTAIIDNEVSVPWKMFTATDRNYLDIGNDLVPSDGLKLANMMFWDNLIKKLIIAKSETPENFGDSDE